MKTVYRHSKALDREFQGVDRLLQREKKRRQKAEGEITKLRAELVDRSIIEELGKSISNLNQVVVKKSNDRTTKGVYLKQPNGDLSALFVDQNSEVYIIDES